MELFTDSDAIMKYTVMHSHYQALINPHSNYETLSRITNNVKK